MSLDNAARQSRADPVSRFSFARDGVLSLQPVMGARPALPGTAAVPLNRGCNKSVTKSSLWPGDVWPMCCDGRRCGVPAGTPWRAASRSREKRSGVTGATAHRPLRVYSAYSPSALRGMRHDCPAFAKAVLFYRCSTTPRQDTCSRKGRSGREASVSPAGPTKRKARLESST